MTGNAEDIWACVMLLVQVFLCFHLQNQSSIPLFFAWSLVRCYFISCQSPDCMQFPVPSWSFTSFNSFLPASFLVVTHKLSTDSHQPWHRNSFCRLSVTPFSKLKNCITWQGWPAGFLAHKLTAAKNQFESHCMQQLNKQYLWWRKVNTDIAFLVFVVCGKHFNTHDRVTVIHYSQHYDLY